MAVARKTFIATWQAALEHFGRSPLAPITVIAGEAPFVKERLLDAARAASKGEVEIFTRAGSEDDRVTLQRLLDVLTTPSLFGGSHLVLARDADALFRGKGLGALEALLEGPPPPHRLLATVEALDGRSRLAKRLKQVDGLVSLPVMRDAAPPWHEGGPYLETDLNAWIVAEARLQGLDVGLPVADELARRIGNEPGRIAQALARLGALADGDTALTLEAVRTHVPHTSIRLLALYEDALRDGDLPGALELADRMVHEGVADPFLKLVTGASVPDVVLRGLGSNLARALEAHDRLTPDLRAALATRPWKRAAADSAALDDVLGRGGRRVFLEKDLRRSGPAGTRSAFRVALKALRRNRDGAGISLHAETVRLARAFAARGAQRP